MAQTQNQIADIDKTATDKAKTARQKQLDAQKKRLRDERAANAQQANTLKDQIKAIQGRFKEQLDAAREGIGALFAGAISDPNAARRTLGLSTGGTGAGALTASLKAQTAQAAQFQRDLNRLIRRGAPDQLVKELRAAGVAGAGTQAHTLATATGPALKAFLVEFGKREKLALTTTKTIMRSQLVTLTADKVQLTKLKTEITNHTHVHLNGKEIAADTTKHQDRAKKRTAPQRTGRYAGTSFLVQG